MEEKIIDIQITDLGKKVIKSNIKTSDLIEQITPNMLKKDSGIF